MFQEHEFADPLEAARGRGTCSGRGDIVVAPRIFSSAPLPHSTNQHVVALLTVSEENGDKGEIKLHSVSHNNVESATDGSGIGWLQ